MMSWGRPSSWSGWGKGCGTNVRRLGEGPGRDRRGAGAQGSGSLVSAPPRPPPARPASQPAPRAARAEPGASAARALGSRRCRVSAARPCPPLSLGPPRRSQLSSGAGGVSHYPARGPARAWSLVLPRVPCLRHPLSPVLSLRSPRGLPAAAPGASPALASAPQPRAFHPLPFPGFPHPCWTRCAGVGAEAAGRLGPPLCPPRLCRPMLLAVGAAAGLAPRLAEGGRRAWGGFLRAETVAWGVGVGSRRVASGRRWA